MSNEVTLPPRARAQIVPGDAVVVRWDVATIVIGGDDDDVARILNRLSGPTDQPLEADELLEGLSDLAEEAASDHHDYHLAAAVHTPTGLRLVEVGRCVAALTGERLLPVTGRQRNLPELSGALWVGLGSADGLDLDREAERLDLLDLRSGVVRGRGVILIPGPTADVPTNAAADTALPQPAFDVVDLNISPEPDRQPLAVVASLPSQAATPEPGTQGPGTQKHGSTEVLGVLCSRSHFNNPSAAYCQVCGISMVHVTHHLVPGARPTLGFLVFDSGATYALDRHYIIGRGPHTPEDQSFSDPPFNRHADPLVVDDLEHTVSRAHARLSLDGWDVSLTDLGSTNGSFLWNREGHRWEALVANQPVSVPPGTTLAVGRVTFVYETVARST